MGGGLIQLVAYGAQDIYLTGDPQITFFKAIYRRHTNFSMESIEQTFKGTLSNTGGNVSCSISRNGDLIHDIHIRIKNKTSSNSCSCKTDGIRPGCNIPCSPIPIVLDTTTIDATNVFEEPEFVIDRTNNEISTNANDCINSLSIEIGGQLIDKHYGDWLNIWTQLTDRKSVV